MTMTKMMMMMMMMVVMMTMMMAMAMMMILHMLLHLGMGMITTMRTWATGTGEMKDRECVHHDLQM